MQLRFCTRLVWHLSALSLCGPTYSCMARACTALHVGAYCWAGAAAPHLKGGLYRMGGRTGASWRTLYCACTYVWDTCCWFQRSIHVALYLPVQACIHVLGEARFPSRWRLTHEHKVPSYYVTEYLPRMCVTYNAYRCTCVPVCCCSAACRLSPSRQRVHGGDDWQPSRRAHK